MYELGDMIDVLSKFNEVVKHVRTGRRFSIKRLAIIKVRHISVHGLFTAHHGSSIIR